MIVGERHRVKARVRDGLPERERGAERGSGTDATGVGDKHALLVEYGQIRALEQRQYMGKQKIKAALAPPLVQDRVVAQQIPDGDELRLAVAARQFLKLFKPPAQPAPQTFFPAGGEQ